MLNLIYKLFKEDFMITPMNSNIRFFARLFYSAFKLADKGSALSKIRVSIHRVDAVNSDV